MREIIFRGKRICENKNWVEGCLLNLDNDDSGHVFIVPFFRSASTIPICRIVEYTSSYVSPETVGQYTGVIDKNGKKIFEGDIVRSYDPDYPESQMDCGVGQVEFYAGLWYVSGEVHNSLYDLSTISCKELEIIGNIYDNPELLEDNEK